MKSFIGETVRRIEDRVKEGDIVIFDTSMVRIPAIINKLYFFNLLNLSNIRHQFRENLVDYAREWYNFLALFSSEFGGFVVTGPIAGELEGYVRTLEAEHYRLLLKRQAERTFVDSHDRNHYRTAGYSHNHIRIFEIAKQDLTGVVGHGIENRLRIFGEEKGHDYNSIFRFGRHFASGRIQNGWNERIAANVDTIVDGIYYSSRDSRNVKIFTFDFDYILLLRDLCREAVARRKFDFLAGSRLAVYYQSADTKNQELAPVITLKSRNLGYSFSQASAHS